MATLNDTLVALYCQHSTAQIEAGDGTLLLQAFGVDQPEQLLAMPGYAEAFALVSGCAAVVDGLVERHPLADTQVRESIRLLRRLIDDGASAQKVATTQALVQGRLLPAWPPAEQALYARKKEILDWRDFFVSYTNRDAPATNQQFRELIKSCLGVAPKGEQLKSNYLARVITRHLRRYQQLNGFFDEDDLRVGENIQNEVDAYCTKAFALVQLIEPLSFDKEPPQNWCFHEYRQFSENPTVNELLGHKDRHYFILVEPEFDTIRPANLPPAYQDWAKRIDALKQFHLALKGERNTTLRAKIKTIAAQILALRAEVIDRWLSA